MQAENPSQSAWAVASRAQHRDAAELEALLDRGSVVRTHVLRPTWHFVAAQDIGWLLELTASRIRPLIARQLGDSHGLAGAGLDRVTSVVLQALSEQPDQTREQLADCLRGQGVEPRGQMLMLLLALLELDRLICSGRRLAGAHTYAAFADRVPSSRRLDRDEALAELALRYFTGHGPATERDLAYWATLTLSDVRRGRTQVGDRLASFEHDGRTFWHAPDESPPGECGAPTGHLLQILDEVYRGYQDSRMVLDNEGIVPSGRETAIGMALVDARMVARMKRSIGRRVVFEITPYNGTLEPSHRSSVEQVRRGRGGQGGGLRRDHRPRRPRPRAQAGVLSGVLLGEWGRSTKQGQVEEFRVYRTRKGKHAVHLKRSKGWTTDKPPGEKPDTGWRSWIGDWSSDAGWGVIPAESTLTVADSLEELKEILPAGLYDIVAAVADQAPIEDLDI